MDYPDFFHPAIRECFSETVGRPTDIQSKAWPEIVSGKHVLVTAPTGSGKTLTAFLWSIHQLVSGAWQAGQVRVLYVSPLKALNNDVRRNLTGPLSELKEHFNKAGEDFPDIRVLTRSGDTPQDERRRMLRKPPEILITTPESLNILISSKNSRRMLGGVATVILDEIHAVVGSKRGTHLITAVDRLVPLCGEFQRIALSATVRPAGTVADFVGGYQVKDGGYEKRRVSIIRSEASKEYAVRIRSPESDMAAELSKWPGLVRAFKDVIAENRSTLFFANSRRITEKVTRWINEDEPEELAYSHHGSLSKEIRLAVEQKLKNGELKAIVATNSLELGIDIGDLERVALIQSPKSVSSAIQRIGRSGHSVGGVSRGELFPTHGRDFLNAAVIARCVMDRDIEAVQPVEAPLDVLAQVVLSMSGTETWDIDRLFAFLKTSYPYRDLSRRQFDLVLEMLAGRYADARLRELKPRVSIDRVDNTVAAKSGAMLIVFTAGGTIPDRGYFNLRIRDSKAKIGELDEEFVWERQLGDTFAMGAQVWRILHVTHNDVEVVPAESRPGIIPFWKAETMNRDFHFSMKIADFLEHSDECLDDDGFVDELVGNYFMEPAAAEDLVDFLKLQKETTGTDLPHRRHLLIEHFDDPLNKADSKQVILHTTWGAKANRPFALALAAAWEEKFNYSLEVYTDDDAVLLMLPHDFNAADVLNMVGADNVESLIRKKLEKTGFFGARFRENAGRALLLPKIGIKKRMPLWMNRLRARKLMEAVKSYSDFPILLETWRNCLQDEFDLENLKAVLDEIASGAIRISETTTTAASPFAGGLIWEQTNYHMYEDDTPGAGMASSLSDELIREVAMSSHLRPKISDESIRILDEKLKRTAPGYAPGTPADLLDWVAERLFVPGDEWLELLAAMQRDHGIDAASAVSPIAGKTVRISLPGAEGIGECAVENLPRITEIFGVSVDELLTGPASDAVGESMEKIFRKRFKAEGSQAGAWEPATLEAGAWEPATLEAGAWEPADLEAGAWEPADLKAGAWEPADLEDGAWEPADLKAGAWEPAALNGEVASLATDFLAQWLAYYGPVEEKFIAKTLGLSGALESLIESGGVIRDRFRETGDIVEVCERNNLEILLRMERRLRRPAFKALPAEQLPLFMAAWQGLAKRGDCVEDLQERLDRLFGFPAPAAAWEENILPARMQPCHTSWTDGLMSESGLVWFGCGEKKLGFAFEEDIELFSSSRRSAEIENEIAGLMPDRRGRFGFFEICGHSNLSSKEASEALWRLAWKGAVTNDSFAVVRKGILNKFAPAEIRNPRQRSRRSQFNRWKATRPIPGNWHVIEPPDEKNVIEKEEIVKDRVRQLFRRYGVLFREIVARELPVMKWGKIFRMLRLMELSGEIFSGYFFDGVHGVQFISGEAFRFINRPLPEDAVFWMNAADPASLCGSGLQAMKNMLPARLASTHLVFHGSKLVIVSKRNGKSLDIRVGPDHPFLREYFSFFKSLLGREFNPVRWIMVETVNGVRAFKSEYAKPLKEFGFSEDYKGLELRRSDC